jgi:hypothetical protein
MPRRKPSQPRIKVTLLDAGESVEVEIGRDAEVTFAFTDDRAEPVRIRRIESPHEAATALSDKIAEHKRRGGRRAAAIGRGYVWQYECAVAAEVSKLRRSIRKLEQLGQALVAVAEVADAEKETGNTAQ